MNKKYKILFTALVAWLYLVSPSMALDIDVDGNDKVDVAYGGTNTATAAANYVFAGPTSGGATTPAFRALVASDIPDISATYATQADLSTAADITASNYLLLSGLSAMTGDLVLTESADHSSTPGAGYGYLWVRSDTPNVLVFTNDAGTDTVLGSGGGSMTYPGAGIAVSTGSAWDTSISASYLDQDVSNGASPSLDGANFTGIPPAALDFFDTEGSASLSAEDRIPFVNDPAGTPAAMYVTFGDLWDNLYKPAADALYITSVGSITSGDVAISDIYSELLTYWASNAPDWSGLQITLPPIGPDTLQLSELGESLAFTSGGTYQIAIGDTITGETSTETARVLYVVLSSGTWAGGDAAGTLILDDVSGVFQSENLAVDSNSNVATISGDSAAQTTPFQLANPHLISSIISTAEATGAVEFDYPPRAEGWHHKIMVESAYAVTLDPNGTENWYLNGIQQGAGVAIVLPGVVGIMATVYSTEDNVFVEVNTKQDSAFWDAGGMTPDGTQCADADRVTINSGPVQYTVVCADNDGSTLYGHIVMPPNWDGGTVTFTHEYLQTAADTGALNGDIACQCRGLGEIPSSTWGSEVAIDDAAVTGSNAVDQTTSASATCAGTCAANDSLWWRYQVDATGTDTAVATLHNLGMRMDFTTYER
jgi:hypothetical protein